jgi:GNAT superfamily N-acetyltransferase
MDRRRRVWLPNVWARAERRRGVGAPCAIVAAVSLVWLEEGGGTTCAELLATVPHWFGIAEANAGYRRVADRCPTLVAHDDDGHAVGFLTVVRHSPHAAEVHVMAVRPELHRNGIGRTLITAAEDRLRDEGVEYLQVKTLSASAGDKPYLGTLAFYTALDFRVLEEMPSFWDADNPAVVLIKHL